MEHIWNNERKCVKNKFYIYIFYSSADEAQSFWYQTTKGEFFFFVKSLAITCSCQTARLGFIRLPTSHCLVGLINNTYQFKPSVFPGVAQCGLRSKQISDISPGIRLDWWMSTPPKPPQKSDAPHRSHYEALHLLFSLPPGCQDGQLRQVPTRVWLALHRLQCLLLYHKTCNLSYMVSLRQPLAPQEAL